MQTGGPDERPLSLVAHNVRNVVRCTSDLCGRAVDVKRCPRCATTLADWPGTIAPCCILRKQYRPREREREECRACQEAFVKCQRAARGNTLPPGTTRQAQHTASPRYRSATTAVWVEYVTSTDNKLWKMFLNTQDKGSASCRATMWGLIRGIAVQATVAERHA